jgi:hypothetical protein
MRRYVWGGNQSGLLVDNNVCHNVSSYAYGAWGLYNDQTTTSVTHTNNVVFDTQDACYHDHEGHNVSLRNNIFVKAANTAEGHSDGALRSAAADASQGWWAAFDLHTNVIVATTNTAPLFSLGNHSQWALSTFDYNCYFQVRTHASLVGVEWLALLLTLQQTID